MKVAVLDIDGTLADNTHREYLVEGLSPDWDAFFDDSLVLQDTLVPLAKEGVNLLAAECDELVFLTGRPETTRGVTTEWLERYFGIRLATDSLWMRTAHHGHTSSALGRVSFKFLTMAKYIRPLFHRPEFIFVDDEEDNLRMFQTYFAGKVFKAPECWYALTRGVI